jgi:hypothetical protein
MLATAAMSASFRLMAPRELPDLTRFGSREMRRPISGSSSVQRRKLERVLAPDPSPGRSGTLTAWAGRVRRTLGASPLSVIPRADDRHAGTRGGS